MDDELIALEAELQQLRPIAPSAALRANIAKQLAMRRRHRVGRWAALPLAAAAAVALLLMPSRRPAATVAASAPVAGMEAEPSDAGFDPVAAENVLVDTLDEGLVTLANGAPARQFRQVYVDTITWRNARTNASLRWTLPREEVRVLPISYQ